MEHKAYLWITILVLCLWTASSALIYYPQIPVSTETLLGAQIALDNWSKDLNANYSKPTENPKLIKNRTDLVVGQLQKMRKELDAYNNVMVGGGNAVSGSKNIIIGNYNSVYGSNNFIFSQGFYYANVKNGGYATKINNFLVNDKWVAELDRK